jgi:formylglycine-generating enzyme required for sulfatase activity
MTIMISKAVPGSLWNNLALRTQSGLCITTSEGMDRWGPYGKLSIGAAMQRFRQIPPGEFMMGSELTDTNAFSNEYPRHLVRISKGFWLADTACSQLLWKELTGQNPSRFSLDEGPVERVSWNEIMSCIKCANEISAELRLDLPTEAEWEYACRAGESGPYGLTEEISPQLARYLPGDDGAHSGTGGGPVAVGTLPPSRWALYEMHGNVWEWCKDGLRKFSTGIAVDPVGPNGADDDRVVRGGSWGSDARHVRAAYRSAYPAQSRSSHVGFRLVRRPTDLTRA